MHHRRLAAGQQKVLALNLLGNAIWAVAMLGGDLTGLQDEMVVRCESPTDDLAFTALEVLWASAYARQLPARLEDSLSQSVRSLASRLDRTPALSSARESSSGLVSQKPVKPVAFPRVVQWYSDRLVLYKPPGWQAGPGGNTQLLTLGMTFLCPGRRWTTLWQIGGGRCLHGCTGLWQLGSRNSWRICSIAVAFSIVLMSRALG